MKSLQNILRSVPLPQNSYLRVIIVLFYLSLAIYTLPFLIGGLIAFFLYRHGEGKTIKYGLTALVLLVTFTNGSSWVAGSSENSKPATTKASTVEIQSPSPEPTEQITQTPTVTIEESISEVPPLVPTKIKILTPTPTNTIIYPTAAPSYESNGLSNDKYYINSEGNEVHSPAYSNSIPAGATAICGDGTYSFSQSRRGTCSHHGGVSQWL